MQGITIPTGHQQGGQTAHHTINTTGQHGPVSTPAQRQFLATLYGQRSGYVELAYINGNPKTDNTKTHGFYRWPEQARKLADAAAALAEQFGNVYVSSTLYATPSRRQPLETNIVFVDDAPEQPALAYSLTVQTSPNKRHAYYVCNRLLDNTERQQLARNAAYALAADKSGSDLKQLVRLPDTYNTYSDHTVKLGQFGPAYTYEQLCSAWPRLPEQAAGAGTGWLDWSAVDAVNVASLLGRDGLPKRLTNKESKTAKVLLGQQGNRSDDRYAVAFGLALVGYEPHVIAALLVALTERNSITDKSRQQFFDDCERVTGKVIARLGSKYNPTPERQSSQQGQQASAREQAIAIAAKRQRGRPKRASVADYLRLIIHNIDAANVWLASRQQVAAASGLSLATIGRYEQQLAAAGVASRQTNSSRSASWLAVNMAEAAQFLGGDFGTKEAVLGILKNTKKARKKHAKTAIFEETSTRIAKPKTAKRKITIGEHTPQDGPQSSPPAGDSVAPAAQPVSPLAQPVGACTPKPTKPRSGWQPFGQQLTGIEQNSGMSLRAAVAEALDEIPERYSRIDRATGAIEQGNATPQRIAAYVAARTGRTISPEAIRLATAKERASRAGNIFEQARQQAASAGNAEVTARAKSTAGRYAQAMRKLREGQPQPKINFYQTMAAIWASEEARRTEAQQQRWELTEQADQVLADMRKRQPAKAKATKPAKAKAATTTTTTTTAAPAAMLAAPAAPAGHNIFEEADKLAAAASTLVERLKARQQAQQASA